MSGWPFQPSLMIVGKVRNNRVEHLKDATLGQAPALIANVRLGWKGLPGTNTLAYYNEYLWITAMIFLQVQGTLTEEESTV